MYFCLLLLHIAETVAVIRIVRIASHIKSDNPVPKSCSIRLLSKLSCYNCQRSPEAPQEKRRRPSQIKIYPSSFGQMPSNTRVSTATLPRIRGTEPFDRINSASSCDSSGSGIRSPTESPSSVTSSDSRSPLQQRCQAYTWTDIALMWNRLFIWFFCLLRFLVIVIFLVANRVDCGTIFCKY